MSYTAFIRTKLTEAAPSVFYHGTNIISAAQIVKDGVIRADNPVDGDGNAVVCVTEKSKIARMFAIEFERLNSRLEIGAIFVLDGRVAKDFPAQPYSAETASQNEFEYRIQGDIPLATYMQRLRLVGKTAKLKSDWYLERLYEEEWQTVRRAFPTFPDFYDAIARVTEMAS